MAGWCRRLCREGRGTGVVAAQGPPVVFIHKSHTPSHLLSILRAYFQMGWCSGNVSAATHHFGRMPQAKCLWYECRDNGRDSHEGGNRSWARRRPEPAWPTPRPSWLLHCGDWTSSLAGAPRQNSGQKDAFGCILRPNLNQYVSNYTCRRARRGQHDLSLPEVPANPLQQPVVPLPPCRRTSPPLSSSSFSSTLELTDSLP